MLLQHIMTSEEMGDINMTIRIMARRRKSITSFKERKIVAHLKFRVFSVLNQNMNVRQSYSHSLFYKAFRVFHFIKKMVGHLIRKIWIHAVVASSVICCSN